MGFKEIYYIQLDALCIMILGFILVAWSKQKRDISTGRVIIKLVLYLSMLFCLVDGVAGVISGHTFFGSTALIYITNMLYYILIICICFGWLYYAVLRIGRFEKLLSNRMNLLLIPAILFSIFVMTTPFHKLVFVVEDGVYKRGILVSLHWLVCLFYVIYGFGLIHVGIKKEKSKVKREEYKSILYFPIMPIIMLVLQAFFPGISTIQMGITFAILILYTGEQNSMIQTDDLTKLNNRRSLDTYIESTISRANSPVDFTFLMIDINRFKEINDNHGHLMGDQILKSVSLVLKNACEGSPKRVFLCRYGGDEFIIVGVDLEYDEVSVIKEGIVRGMRNKLQYAELDFQITASIGVSKGKCRDTEDAEHLIRVADEDMYDQKKNYRAE